MSVCGGVVGHVLCFCGRVGWEEVKGREIDYNVCVVGRVGGWSVG